jgi:hypothetical protein
MIWVWDYFPSTKNQAWHLFPVVKDAFGGRVASVAVCNRQFWSAFMYRGDSRFPEANIGAGPDGSVRICPDCENAWTLQELAQ